MGGDATGFFRLIGKIPQEAFIIVIAKPMSLKADELCADYIAECRGYSDVVEHDHANATFHFSQMSSSFILFIPSLDH